MSVLSFLIIVSMLWYLAYRWQVRQRIYRELHADKSFDYSENRQAICDAADAIIVRADTVLERFPHLAEDFEPGNMPCPKTDEPHAWGSVRLAEREHVFQFGEAAPVRIYAYQLCADCKVSRKVDFG